MSEWWAAKTPRERALLALMALVGGAVLYLYAAFLPLKTAVEREKTRAQSAHATLQEMRQAQAQGLTASPGASAAAPLRTEVTDAAQRAGLVVERLQPEAEGLTVTLAPAGSQQAFGYVAAMERGGARVSRLSAERATEEKVRVQVTFAEGR